MTVWAWIGCALLVGWGGSAWWAYRRVIALTADRDHALADLLDLRHRLAMTQQALSASERVADALQVDHKRTLDQWEKDVARCRADFSSDAQASREEIKHLRAHLDQSAAHVKALSEATALSEAAIQARADWTRAFTRNFTPTHDCDTVPAKGWQCVLLTADGAVESTRTLRDGNAPTRISRGHGQITTWYRLARIDGLSLIYEPEHDPTTTAVA